MKKIFVAEFGGTPSRTELCLLMNCGAGLCNNMSFSIYPFDKDIKSPNYVNSRNCCRDYQSLRHLIVDKDFASADVERRESLFEEVLKNAGLGKKRESLRNLMSSNGCLNENEQMLLDVCFSREEQEKDLEKGYYGKANIGAVTSSYLVYKKAYDNLNLVKDIENIVKEGGEGVDVVIVCSSFGGTGASLGINFGEYLAEKFHDKRKFLRLHCIHIQPYFSFPDPEDEDKFKIDCHDFYAKSASVITTYGSREDFIRRVEEGEADNGKEDFRDGEYVFDSFYYLGQEELDRVSEKNSPKDDQENSLHIIDMLVGLAVQDAAGRSAPVAGRQLYGYLYATNGVRFLTWENMKHHTVFKEKHISFARFSAFVVQVLEPWLSLKPDDYASEALTVHLFGAEKKFFSHKAKVQRAVDEEFRKSLNPVVSFCRNYLAYWQQIETATRYGRQEMAATRFFNQTELKRILEQKNKLEDGRALLLLDNLTKAEGIRVNGNGTTGKEVYDTLCLARGLKSAAGEGKSGERAAALLLEAVYNLCRLKA